MGSGIWIQGVLTDDGLFVVRPDGLQRPGLGAPLVALDRDGTLIEWVPHLRDPRDVRLIPGAAEAVAALVEEGCTVVIVTNQSVVGRGLLSMAGLSEISEIVHKKLCSDGIGIAATYVCPHAPSHGCACRKPGIGMLQAAWDELAADRSRTWVVGDNPSDMLMAQRANVRGIRVMTGIRDAATLSSSIQEVPSVVEAADAIRKALRAS